MSPKKKAFASLTVFRSLRSQTGARQARFLAALVTVLGKLARLFRSQARTVERDQQSKRSRLTRSQSIRAT